MKIKNTYGDIFRFRVIILLSVMVAMTVMFGKVPYEKTMLTVQAEEYDTTYDGSAVGNVRVRSGAGTDNPVLTDESGSEIVLSPGSKVTITGEDTAPNGKQWYHVSFSYGGDSYTGYCFAEYIEKSEEPVQAATPTPEPTVTPVPTFTPTPTPTNIPTPTQVPAKNGGGSGLNGIIIAIAVIIISICALVYFKHAKELATINASGNRSAKKIKKIDEKVNGVQASNKNGKRKPQIKESKKNIDERDNSLTEGVYIKKSVSKNESSSYYDGKHKQNLYLDDGEDEYLEETKEDEDISQAGENYHAPEGEYDTASSAIKNADSEYLYVGKTQKNRNLPGSEEEKQEDITYRDEISSLREHDMVIHKYFGRGEVFDNNDVRLMEVHFGNDTRFLNKEQLVREHLIKVISDENVRYLKR